MPITGEALKAYLMSPFHCPNCGPALGLVSWGEIEEESDSIVRYGNICNKCNFHWSDILETKVIGIREEEPIDEEE